MKADSKDNVVGKRDDEAIVDLQKKKIEARDRLRSFRAEMKRLDIELINAGANRAELHIACW
ncbi:MAG TPA: hypothetical protein VF762_23020 [Blastocatellia bacterium]